MPRDDDSLHAARKDFSISEYEPPSWAHPDAPQAIHGLPITPTHLLDEMRGASFCVSFQSPSQLARAISLLGPNSILKLDNGAFTAWRQNEKRKAAGQKPIQLDSAYWERFWAWSEPILALVPQAIAVIPDVIDGTVDQNAEFIRWAPLQFSDQLMPVWHLHEPVSYLTYLMESGFPNIAFGSSGEFSTLGTERWRYRIRQAFDHIDAFAGDIDNGQFRPRIHLMRGLGQLKVGEFPFATADSTMVARNHWRDAKVLPHPPKTPARVHALRARIESHQFPDPPGARWPLASWEPYTPRRLARRRPLQGHLFADAAD